MRKPCWLEKHFCIMSKVLFFLFCLTLQLNAQTLKGLVIDETDAPLEGASVFFNGTTVGTITNTDGKFEIKMVDIQNPVLVFQYIGYETKMINEFSTSNISIKLIPKISELTEVIIKPNPFSRKECIEAFKKSFLGVTKAGKSCEILNEDVIEFEFDVTTNTLYAHASEPIEVLNNYLGYHISFNLIQHHTKFSKRTLNQDFAKENFFIVTTFFKDINDDKKSREKNRKKVYLGSVNHFFKSLADNQLKENNFLLGKKGFVEPVEKHFTIEQLNNIQVIKVLFDKIRVPDNIKVKQKKMINVYYKHEPSSMEVDTKEIYVDEYGNYAPIENVKFGGAMGTYRAGNMLPFNFSIEIQ